MRYTEFNMRHTVMDIRLRIINQFAKFFLFLLLFAFFLPGTSSFGFDSATSCSPNGKMSRRGRAQTIASIPCNLDQQAYCNLPGALYPWHAVRRFIHENQGLVKRMYGDVRHISIIRKEFENNDIDTEDMAATAERYSRDGRQAKYMNSEFQNVRNNDVLMEPHFRPVSTTTTSTTTPTTTTTSTTSAPTPAASKPKPYGEYLDDVDLDSDDEDEDDSIEANSVFEDSSDKSPIATDSVNIKVVESPNLAIDQNKTETATISTTLRIVQQLKKTDDAPPLVTDNIPDEKDNQESNTVETNVADSNPIRTTLLATSEKVTGISASNAPSTEGTPKPTEPYFEKKKTEKPVSSMEGQLFQDTVQKEPPVFANMRGVNACPVKEEVVAPFWANNTRGEVLALLNLYPFEQYVHWEKCTHEHKQMYCRDGCRCEQQYRLHRLLAYDPHNECRGIFSDWFRFPSCCICKCYDIPLEFRATSRSPRAEHIDQPHPIDVAESEVKRAIYEHATEDWYRPRDELEMDLV